MKIVNTILLISLLLMTLSVLCPVFSSASDASYSKPIEDTQLSRTTEYKKVIVLDSIPKAAEKIPTITHDSTVLVNPEPLLAFVGEYSIQDGDVRELLRYKQNCMYTRDINAVLERVTKSEAVPSSITDFNCYTTTMRSR